MNKLLVNIIGAAQHVGCSCDGVQYGPNSIRECGLVEKLLANDVEIIDSGNIDNDDSIVCAPNEKLRNVEQIADFCRRLSTKVATTLCDGQMPLVIGGDHSLSIGSVSGALEFFGADDLGIIWIDAHADVNTPETSPSGNVHGMTIASLLGLIDNKVLGVCGNSPRLKPSNIIYLATRDMDSGEEETVKEYGISVVQMKDIMEQGLDAALQHLQSLLDRLTVSNIYMSIDIDVIDPKLAPGTGVPVPNGIDKSVLYNFLDMIANTNKVRGFELVEVNPLIDNEDNRTSILAVDIINHLISRISKYPQNQ